MLHAARLFHEENLEVPEAEPRWIKNTVIVQTSQSRERIAKCLFQFSWRIGANGERLLKGFTESANRIGCPVVRIS